VNAVDLLEQLSNAFGPSSHEDDVRDIIVDLVKPLVDELRVDRMGNVIATRRGRRDDIVMLDAHMDEVGFLVSYIDEAGFLRLMPLGGWDARVLPGHVLNVRTNDGSNARGIVGTLPPHITGEAERSRAFALDDLFVDIGATSKDDVLSRGIDIGSPVAPGYPFERADDDLVFGKAFDDRAGCTVAACALDALQGEDLDTTLVVTFTTSEELGLRGARTVANQVTPAVMVALEGTTAVDVPGVSGAKKLSSMGKGPTVTIADRSAIADRRVVKLLEEVGNKNQIPFQRKLPGGGGTDAAALQQTGEGVLVGVISVPCRYIHATMSMLRPSDLDAAVELTTAFTRAAGSLLP
jgi:putative aminopeptidase FrvX